MNIKIAADFAGYSLMIGGLFALIVIVDGWKTAFFVYAATAAIVGTIFLAAWLIATD